MGLTARELADCLDLVPKFPHNTGALSQLDEATVAYRYKFPGIAGWQQAFADARHRHMRSYRSAVGNYTDESWQAAVDAAHGLAEAMRALGDLRLERCQRPTGWGTCNFVLDDDGTCHGTDHTDGGA